jgi:4-amino-4-deoxy-L-arabinose transferase-like glycosyltransferase
MDYTKIYVFFTYLSLCSIIMLLSFALILVALDVSPDVLQTFFLLFIGDSTSS